MTGPLFLWLLACGPAEPAVDPFAERVEAALAEPLPADSLYTLDLPLVNSQGQTARLDVGRGHPTLVSMFYASCPTACPMLVGEVQALEERLSPDELADLRVVLVSLDPDRDTPKVLAEAAERYGVDGARWTLNRTEDAHVRTLSALLDIQYRDLPDGEMNHSSILTLLDRQGRIITRREGLGGGVDPLVEAIRALP
jgi:protein SCO1/2